MDKLAALHILMEVAKTGGFSTAAERLGLATSSVSRAMDALEASLGSVLLTRSRREVSLTDAGRTYVEQISQVLEGLSLADESVFDTGDAPSGVLRITVPTTYSRVVLASYLIDFLRAYPQILLDIVVTDRYCDLGTDRIDVAVRVVRVNAITDSASAGGDKGLVCHELLTHDYVLVATPAYLSARGPQPQIPEDLTRHECFCLAGSSGALFPLTTQRWFFRGSAGTLTVEVGGHLYANSLEIVFEAVLAGRGIALLPEWMVASALRSGSLRRILGQWEVHPHAVPSRVYATHLPNRRHSTRAQTFIAFLKARMASNIA